MDKFVEEAREEAKQEAKRNLKVFFMLQEVAQVEKIAVTEMELYNEVARQARQQKRTSNPTFANSSAKAACMASE